MSEQEQQEWKKLSEEGFKRAGHVKLKLKAKHFIDTNFNSPCDCAISKAAREFFNMNISEGVNSLVVHDGTVVFKVFTHDAYNFSAFSTDKKLALKVIDPNQVIRTITLILKK